VAVCKLTGKSGAFVKAHIMPQALTRPEKPNIGFIESGQNRRPVRRRTSWYDPQLVTLDGEKSLSEIDFAGVNELRRLRLVWSSWGPMLQLPASENLPIGSRGWGLRTILGADLSVLRRFFLSLLWRASESKLDAFLEIKISTHENDFLRDFLQGKRQDNTKYFPITLIQISTRGDSHNLAPLLGTRNSPYSDHDQNTVDFFRFYIDGLIIHFGKNADKFPEHSSVYVGRSEILSVLTVEYEHSWQKENLEKTVAFAFDNWRGQMIRMTRGNG